VGVLTQQGPLTPCDGVDVYQQKLQDPDKNTVMANAYSFADPRALQPTQLFPAALLGALPLFLLFLAFQRQVVQGMTQGAVK
jgi:raffinose/stachyose/melibiose transport system permease protein